MCRPVLALAAALAAVASAVAFSTTPSGTTGFPESGSRDVPAAGLPRVPEPPPGTPTPSRPGTPTAPAPVPPPRAARAEPLVGFPYWVARDFENQIALFCGAPSDVLFLGDSITDFLAHGEGKELWDQFYAPLGALDFGVAGARTSHVLWQVESGQVAIAAPRVVVLLIGTNNLALGDKPQDVAAGVERIVNTIGAQLPDTRVLLLGLLPRGAKANDPFRAAIVETNRLLADLDDGDRVTFLDVGPWFLGADGSIPTALMPDALHPNYWGYFFYSVAIWETLMDLRRNDE